MLTLVGEVSLHPELWDLHGTELNPKIFRPAWQHLASFAPFQPLSQRTSHFSNLQGLDCSSGDVAHCIWQRQGTSGLTALQFTRRKTSQSPSHSTLHQRLSARQPQPILHLLLLASQAQLPLAYQHIHHNGRPSARIPRGAARVPQGRHPVHQPCPEAYAFLRQHNLKSDKTMGEKLT